MDRMDNINTTKDGKMAAETGNMVEESENRLEGTDDEESFEELLRESFAKQEIREGEIVKGTVINVTKDYVTIDIGYKSEGHIAIEEFMDMEERPPVSVGDTVDVLLENREDDQGNIILSKEKADKLKIWEDISRACERDDLVEGVITARVKGGLSVDIGVKAFLPGSQVDLRPIRNLEKLIGQKFKFKVIKFNKRRGNIVLSRRVLLEKEREELKKKTLEQLKEGAVMEGIVKNLTEYGAFIDLGGIDGLLHITDMSWGRVNHPSEVFTVGQEVKIKVLKFNPETERVSLGLKQISEDPWTHAEERYPVNSRVKGKVVSLTDYGAFVELEEGIEGLIHISEMSWTKRIKHPSKMVSVSDEVEVQVLDIDVKNKRISLGMKQIEPNPWSLLKGKYPEGTLVRGKVRNITDFGLFVNVEEGIDGLVHISDISWTLRVKHPSEIYSKGDEVEAMVLHIDAENERFSLGIKQLIDDPWYRIPREYPVGKPANCTVLKVADFGCFVELEKGVWGFIHISELSEERIENPKTVVKEGQALRAEVIEVDQNDRKISLSLKRVSSLAEQEHVAKHAPQAPETTTRLGELLKGIEIETPSGEGKSTKEEPPKGK